MGSFNFHKLKSEKANTIHKNCKLRKIANLFRYVEFCVVLVLISRLSFQLPDAIKNSSEYLRGFSINPCFVFLVGNVIIITLFIQSGHFSSHDSKGENLGPDFYEEFIQNSTKYQMIQDEQKKHLKKQSIGTEYPKKQSKKTKETTEYPEKQNTGTEYPKKQSIRTEDIKKSPRIKSSLIKYPQKQSIKRITETEDTIMCHEKQSKKTGDMSTSLEVKDYRRCQSETISRVQSEKPRGVLQRCETENNIERAERMGRNSYPEDGMSNDDFRRTIEAFIARQQRLRKQEQCFASRF